VGSALPASKAFGAEPMKRPASTGAAAFFSGPFCADAASLQPAIPTTLIDINELSRRLSVAKGTLYNWVYLRRIPFVKAGRCVRFDYKEVLETLRQCPIIDTSIGKR
jgi:excisionase family DNA binding protein